jgi:hypothetical protein
MSNEKKKKGERERGRKRERLMGAYSDCKKKYEKFSTADHKDTDLEAHV